MAHPVPSQSSPHPTHNVRRVRPNHGHRVPALSIRQPLGHPGVTKVQSLRRKTPPQTTGRRIERTSGSAGASEHAKRQQACRRDHADVLRFRNCRDTAAEQNIGTGAGKLSAVYQSS